MFNSLIFDTVQTTCPALEAPTTMSTLGSGHHGHRFSNFRIAIVALKQRPRRSMRTWSTSSAFEDVDSPGSFTPSPKSSCCSSADESSRERAALN
jgi:hypothetical protein